MKKILLIFSLFLGVIAKPVLAEEEIVIIDSVATESIYVGQTFPVGIEIRGAQANTTFFYKFYGGDQESQYYIQNDNNLDYNSNWSLFPTLTTDSSGNAYINTFAFIKPNSPTGVYDFYLKLAFPDYSSPEIYTSFSQPIRVLSSILPTPIPTQIPTTTVKPTLTRTPTPTISSILTPNQQPPTPTPTPTINLQKFGLPIATSSAIISVTPSGSISNIDPKNSDNIYIQTGSNPSEIIINKITQPRQIPITYLGLKTFFVFLLVSSSFALYCFCLFDYDFQSLFSDLSKYYYWSKPKIVGLYTVIKNYITNFAKNNHHYLKKIFELLKKSFSNLKFLIARLKRKWRFLVHKKYLIPVILAFTIFSFIALKIIFAIDYSPISENLIDNTVSISGSTGDLQLDDTNYRIIRSFPTSFTSDFQTTSADAQTTSVSTTYADSLNLTWNVPSNGDYLILTNASIGRSSTTAARTTKAQLLVNGTSRAESFAADDTDVDIYRPFSGARIQTLNAGSNTIKVQMAATNTSTNRGLIKNIKLSAMRIFNHQYNVPANGTTTQSSYTDIANLTFTPKITEDWLIIGHADITNSGIGGTLSYANLLVGSTQLAEGVFRVANASHYLPFDVHKIISLDANTSYTFKIQMKRTAGTLTYKNVGIYAIPLSNFNGSGSVESIGETSCTTCTSASPLTVSTLNLNTGIGGTYLFTVTGEQKNDSLTVYSGVRFMIGSSMVSQSIVDVGNTAHYSSFLMQVPLSLSTGATSVSVQLFTQTSGTRVRIKDVRINAIRLGAASGQKIEVEYSGVGNTETLTQLDYLVNSGFSLASVGTTIQLWNYNSNTYPTSGDGFLSYISHATPNTFESKNQSITTNPQYFINSTTGAWKMKIKSVTSNGTWIDWSGNQLIFTLTSPVGSTSPSTPTLISPPDSATGQSLTPTFKTVTTDANGDNLQYELKICTDSGMSANCQTFDQTSSNIGWSGQDVGTSAYSSGTTATYVLQVGNSLAENTTYYWKTRAKDYAGSASWSSTQTTAYSFTTNSKPNTPTLVSPSTGTTQVSLTPELKTVTTDPNSDPLQYKIELCTNEAMSTGCNTYDLSSSITGWSGINVGTSAYSSGTTATYTVQVGSSLAASTTYYWRSYAKDPTGTTRWSTTQGTVYSFTTVTPVLVQATFRWSDDDASGESRSQGVGDTWYDSNYDYRAPITITNNVGTTLVDFQTRLTINTSTLISAGKMRSDCNDIRITDNDKETLLNYYIESGCNTTSTVLWAKIPYLAASTTRDIYLYYGYSSASTASSGDNTFAAYDNFEGTSLDTNKWIDWNYESFGTMTISGGTLAIVAPATGGNLDMKTRGIMSQSTFPFTNHIIEVNNRWSYGSVNGNGPSISKQVQISDIQNPSDLCSYMEGGTGQGNQYYFSYRKFSGIFDIDMREYMMNNCINGSNTEVAKTSVSNDTPSSFEIEKYSWFDSSGSKETSGRSTNGGTSFSTLWAQQSQTSLSLPGGYYWGFSATNRSDTSHTVWLDWIRIRKYAATEPTFSLGTETTEPPPAGPSGATWLAAENVGITGVTPNENIRLRFSIANSGSIDTANFRLQVAPKDSSTNCTDVTSGNFTDVTTTVGVNLAVMTTSPNFTNQEATTNQLTDSASTFVPGKMIEYGSNQSDSITLNTNEFTEVEYNFQLTNNVGTTTPYCFRVTNTGTSLSTYTNVAELTTIYIEANVAPSAPYLPYVNNITAQSGQQSPVYGLIDHTPAFSAVFDDPNTSNTASYYQLQIGSDSDWTSAEIWDSTKTAVSGTCNENNRCTDIVYGGGTSLVDGSTYYWRLKFWDNLDVGGSWSDTQQFSMNSVPIVSNVIINGNNSINLSENSSIGISWVATITDTDGYTNLNTATGKLYRSGVGQSCTPDNNNCYQDTSCDFINCVGNTCDALCSANIYFFTEATDVGSTYVNQYYQAWVEVTDNFTEIGSTLSSSTTVDVNTLSAFSIGQSLVYGEVFAGSDTGSSNTIVTVTNTGNSLINLEITGDYMCTDYPSCGGNNIEPYNQQYNLNSFTYGVGTTLSLIPKILNIGISKPTQYPSNSSRNLYWGIGIPGAKPPGNYQGSVTILVD